MEIKLMINWREEKIITRKAYEEEEIPRTVESWKSDSCVLSEWLGNHYYSYDIWVMNEEDRDDVWKKFVHYCQEKALEELEDDGWEDFLLEI